MPRKRTIPIVCRQCGAIFPAWKATATYCSPRCRSAAISTHGETQGDAQSPEYRAWAGIKKRCTNPAFSDFQHYGGRGITICDRWRDSYENFLADVGRRPSPIHSIDRIDVNGHYEPNNVRWATPTEQSRNRRMSRLVTYRGETKCISEWAAAMGVSHTCLAYRLKHGWSIEQALTTPSLQDHSR